MRSRSPIALLCGLAALCSGAGCTSDTPSWALDRVFVLPSEGEATGSITWQIYRRAWKRSFKSRHYLCSVLVAFEGVETAADCPDCAGALSIAPEVADSDCSDALTADPTFVSPARIGFGPISTGGPHPGRSSIGYADYGLGWEVHGWAFPEALESGGEPASEVWDGAEPFAMAPSFAWTLGPTPDATAVSRLAIETSAATPQ